MGSAAEPLCAFGCCVVVVPTTVLSWSRLLRCCCGFGCCAAVTLSTALLVSAAPLLWFWLLQCCGFGSCTVVASAAALL